MFVTARVVLLIAGLVIVARTLLSAIKTFVLPRGVSDKIAQVVFLTTRELFDIRTTKSTTYEARDRIMALYAPISLFMLPVTWLVLVALGYTLMFWSAGVHDWYRAFASSGSSLLTLGFSVPVTVPQMILTFSEAMIGLLLAALLIAYLPTMYTSWSRREAGVAMLETRAGSPPSPAQLFIRLHRIGRLDYLTEIWTQWETWFLDVQESHTSLAAVTFFRSPQPRRSWVTAAGAILDAASLASSTLDLPRDPRQDLCIRSGFLCLREIAALFRIPFEPDPQQGDAISVARVEFDEVYDELAAAGIPLRPDRDRAWEDFSGWRVNYDTVLVALAALTMAPYALWSSDRSVWRRGRFGRTVEANPS